MPTRSAGCYTCRKRKIRCDETRPGCKRCEVHGVPCPGYREERSNSNVEFLDLTTFTTQKAKEQYRLKQTKKEAANIDLAHRPITLTWSNSFDTTYTAEFGTDSTSPHSNIDSSSSSDSEGDAERFMAMQQTLLSTDEHETAPYYANAYRPSPSNIRSPSAQRSGLYGYFVDTFLPESKEGRVNSHFVFLTNVVEKSSASLGLQQSMDSLSLLHLGSLYKDQAIIKRAVKQYGNALSSLTKAIAKGQWLYDDDVLASVTVLAACELFEELGKAGAGWGKHVEGANQLVQMRGPDSLKSDLALLLYSNMRRGGYLHALMSRKAPFMAKPEWREVAFRVPQALQDSSTLFYDLALQVPGLLERHDQLDLSSPTALADIDAVLADSAELEQDLRDWFRAWENIHLLLSPTHEPMYHLRPITDFPIFCSLCPDRTFTSAFMFDDFLEGHLYSLYWMTMHYLRRNTQSLQKRRHQVAKTWYPSDDEAVPEDELLGYALNMCHCFPFFCEPVSRSMGSIGTMVPLRLCALYFAEKGHWQWLRWVGSVKNSVFVRGLAPPNVPYPGGSPWLHKAGSTPRVS